ncbi:MULTISPECIES: hypothetical protein [Clostridium]|uniref:hypothetical protein n=1 Tax=Clostridium TaxID=1485 RepID=UPI000C07A231|nr:MULTISPECIES: hypothetical protein [Clostridium]MDU4726638.1 hypothetical protein [Clostridium sp.]
MSESTVIVALITALSAILAPLASTYITNIVQARQKREELLYIQKLEAYKDFTNKAMLFINEYIDNEYKRNIKSTNMENFITSYQTAFLIADKETRRRMSNIDIYGFNYKDSQIYAELFIDTMNGINMAMNDDLLQIKEKSDSNFFKNFLKKKR